MGSIEIQIGVGIEIDGGGFPARVGCSWAFAFSCAASLRRKATSDRLHRAALTRVLVAVASWSAVVLNRFLGWSSGSVWRPIAARHLRANSQSARGLGASPRRYRVQGGLSFGLGLPATLKPRSPASLQDAILSTVNFPGDESPGFELWPFQGRLVRGFLACWWSVDLRSRSGAIRARRL